MELKTYNQAKELQELIEDIQSLHNGLCISRDFDKVEMKIVFREHGEEGARSYDVPSRIALDICARIRQDLHMFEANLKEQFYKL